MGSHLSPYGLVSDLLSARTPVRRALSKQPLASRESSAGDKYMCWRGTSKHWGAVLARKCSGAPAEPLIRLGAPIINISDK